MASEPKLGLAGKLAKGFLRSKLTPLIVGASLLLGILAVVITPREEEPQIIVPMVDLYIPYPGASPKEIESQVTNPMERRLWGIPGVEYLYSMSRPGMALITVRFKVNEPQEPSLVKIYQELAANPQMLPPGAMKPIIKLQTIDDVPFLVLTLHGEGQAPGQLRTMGEVMARELSDVPSTAQVKVTGGARRMVRIEPDPDRLRALNFTIAELQPALQAAEAQLPAGALIDHGKRTELEATGYILQASELKRLVVGVRNQKPIYLADVARVVDAPESEPPIVLFAGAGQSGFEPAVSVTLSKRAGTNATALAEQVLAKVEALRGNLIPRDLKVTVTRNYGETAGDKSNELIEHLLIATLSVIALIFLAMGWRSAVVVGVAVPVTLALTLLITYLFGYTLNRVTLFALIFSIGILVDDAIVVVENIVRHLRLPANQRKSVLTIAIEAVNEVGNPTILATWAVIAAILPMAFVGGLMGPYMRPIPIGSSAAMIFSLIIAFTVTPWAAIRVLKKNCSPAECPIDAEAEIEQEAEHGHAPNDFFTRLYHRVMDPLLAHARWRLIFFLSIVGLLLASCSMVYFGLVKVKMLPFDNKSEFQIILNMPEGSTLEATTQAAREMAAVVGQEPEVVNYQVYAGAASPYNFNGLVRHYYLRNSPHLADIQVNLLPKGERKAQSHEIAKRIRPKVAAIAKKYGATMAVAEVPPGPPVLQTLVAEIYGQTDAQRLKLASKVKELFTTTEGVVDVDWYREAERLKTVIAVDKEKAALNGISEGEIIQAVDLAVKGLPITLFHQPEDKEGSDIVLELPRAERARVGSILNTQLRSGLNPAAPLVPLRELVTVTEAPIDQPIYRKNLKPVIYVTGDVAGAAESPAYAIFALNKELAKLDGRQYGGEQKTIAIYNLKQPFCGLEPTIKWDGEWHITLEVFRDLGFAFCAVMILIYMLMVGWFKDYTVPLVVMAAIPFSLIGILPAHWAFGAFFTATSMIGFMAGAGIVVRNSIILVDFIELRISHGLPLKEAVVEAGAIRFRPMLLTALAVVVGASVILADPIFQGLAISLMFGEIASLLISRMAVPVLYFMLRAHRHAPADAASQTSGENH